MDQNLATHMYAEQTMRVSPTLIMVNHVLALSSMELQQAVHTELEQNPALESVESTTCNACGAATSGLYCPVCLQAVHPTTSAHESSIRDAERAGSTTDDGYDIEDFRPTGTSTSFNNEDFDPLTLVANDMGMAEQLLADIKLSLPEADHSIAEYLVGNLDEQGFLNSPLHSIANELEVPEERVKRVLRILQEVGPVGVGARDLRECMLMQIADMRTRNKIEIAPYVEEVVSAYLIELGEHKYTHIAQALCTNYECVVAVRDFIKKHLQPRPLQERPEGRAWRAPSPTRFVLPDVVIRERDGQLEVEVVESYRFNLKINSMYRHLADSTTRQDSAMTEQEREHIKRYVNRSKMFIANINQRRETMMRITYCLIQLQEEYIRLGVRYLRPLTRAQVAGYLGLHESTVSRATADKYVMLPNKLVIAFSDFFSASLSAKDVIKEIITKEGQPMTDKEIVARLHEQGIRVARRTVTKYRNQLGILPAAYR